MNKDFKKGGFIRLKMSKKTNRAREGFKGRIPDFPQSGRKLGTGC